MRRSADPIDPEAREKTRRRALALLARREHTVKELGEKLARRGDADEAVIRAVVAELADQELVSDLRYAGAYARDAVRLKPRARSRLVRELIEAGVPARVAAPAVDEAFEAEGVDDAALARRLGEAYLRRLAGELSTTQWRRMARHLQRRGFDGGLIYEVCSGILPDPRYEGE